MHWEWAMKSFGNQINYRLAIPYLNSMIQEESKKNSTGQRPQPFMNGN